MQSLHQQSSNEAFDGFMQFIHFFFFHFHLLSQLLCTCHFYLPLDASAENCNDFVFLGAQHLAGRPFLSGCVGSKLKSKFRCCWWFVDKMCHIWNLSCFKKFQLFTKCSKFYGKRSKIIQKKITPHKTHIENVQQSILFELNAPFTFNFHELRTEWCVINFYWTQRKWCVYFVIMIEY